MKPAVLLIGLAALAIADELPPEVVRLARIKQKMRAELEHFPDYVCVENIERFQKIGKLPFRRLDTLRFDVAYVGGKELFAQPGAIGPHTEDIVAYGKAGFIGIGNYSGFLHGLFAMEKARFTSPLQKDSRVPGRIWPGRPALRYDFEYSAFLSNFVVSLHGTSGVVGVRGAIWADAGSLDLLRMEMHAIEIPAELDLLESDYHAIDYARVRIGKSQPLLPKSAEMVMKTFDGEQDRNIMRFSGCRQFTSESIAHFHQMEGTRR